MRVPCDRIGAPGALVEVGFWGLVRGGARVCDMRVPAHAMSISESGILNDRDLVHGLVLFGRVPVLFSL